MMRRVAVLALAAAGALPFTAGAQSTTDPAPGKVVFNGGNATDRNDQYVNAKECQDNGELRVTWEVIATTLPVGAEYEILASNRTGCEDTNPANGIETQPVVPRFPAVSVQQTFLVPISDFRAAFETDIDCATDTKVYVCVRTSGVAVDIDDAEGVLEFQTEAPPPPTLAANQVRPADHAFDVDWSNVSGPPSADSYIIYATRVSNPAEVSRQEVLFETDGRVGGDLALEEYDVQVASVSVAGNEGEKSNAIRATPISVQDFWERYEGRGGVDDGGCATSGGTGLLAALAALLFLRRAGRSRP
jgi:hypothetical protein